MSNGFIHSVPVPRLYKTAAKTVRQVTEEGASLKQLIYEKKHPNLKGVYALATNTLQNAGKLNEIIRKSQLLFKEPRFDPWLARVLITELLWGKGSIKNDSKPIQTILSYENEIREHADNTTSPESKIKNKKEYSNGALMVLIIRNGRIQSRNRSRFKKLILSVISEKKNPEKKNHSENMSLVSVLGTLFIYSIAMFTLPFITFFGLQHYLTNDYHMDRTTSNFISVLAAVVVVNMIIAAYAYKALTEPLDPKDPDEFDNQVTSDQRDKND